MNKQFVVSFECETIINNGQEGEVEKVYFTHRFDFSETMSRVGGMYHPCKKESDFVIFFEGEKEEHIGGLRCDEKYFTLYGNFVSKFCKNERIWVKGTIERKVSKGGNKYVQMKRCKVDKKFSYHA